MAGDNTKYVAVKPTTLSASIASGDSSFTVAEVSDRAGNTLTQSDFGDLGYGVFEPGGANEEQFTFDAISSTTITIATRGLAMKAPYTNVSANQKAHAAGTTVIIYSNLPAFYDSFLNKSNDETIDGDWKFDGGVQFKSTEIPIFDSDPTITDDKQVATKKYADDLAIAGAPDATTTVKGISEIATDAELASGAAAGSGDTTADLVAHAASFNQTAAAGKVPVAEATGKIGEDWLGLSTAGDIVYSDGTDLQRLAVGTSGQFLKTNSGATAPEWVSINIDKFGGDGSDGALDTSGGVVDIDLSNAEYVEKNYSSINIATNNLTFSNPATEGSLVHIRCSGDATISANIVANIGAAGGAGGAGGGDGGEAGIDGSDGSDSDEVLDTVVHYGAGGEKGQTNDGGDALSGNAAAYTQTGVGRLYPLESTDMYRRFLHVVPGTGGGGGGGGGAGATAGDDGDGGAGGAGGIGGGALIIEVAGDINFTGTIDASGTDGSAGTNGEVGQAANSAGGGGGGGGAGGAGGYIVVLYNTQTSVAGSIDVTSGAGGTAGSWGQKNGSPASSTGGGGGEGGSAGASVKGTGGEGINGSDGNGSTGSTGQAGGVSVAESTNGNDGSALSGSTANGDGGAGGAGASGGGGEALILQNIWF